MPRPNPPRLLGGESGLARRVAYERERRGWSTEGLAKRMADVGCAINQSAIWKIENGDPPRRITYDEALAFARVFEMPLVDLAVAPEVAADGELRALLLEHDQVEDQLKKLHRRETEIADAVAVLMDRFPGRFTQGRGVATHGVDQEA
jgi:transcriptional regulator with XRE-family HTH domain